MNAKVLLYFSFVALLGCAKPVDRGLEDFKFTEVPLQYAQGFTIKKAQGYYVVEIVKPYKGAKDTIRYVLYDKESTLPSISADAVIAVPVEGIVATSTTHIPLLDYLDVSDKLIGFPTLDFISSENMRKRIDIGLVRELGVDDALNIEAVVELAPDVVMAYSLSGDMGQFALLQEAGIPVIINAEYLEQHPLGRAEWIKLAGLLFATEQKADSVFKTIESAYLGTKKLVQNSATHSTVISGVVYGDSWYLPGGKNYASQLLSDAGYHFFWANDTTSAFLPLSFEVVFDQGRTADYWIGVASFNSLHELQTADNRYTGFRAFGAQQVYSYNKRIGAKGGSEFLELGYLRPDIILKDLVKIAHPDLLPNYALYFHFKLP